jgi:hypothetical protein
LRDFAFVCARVARLFLQNARNIDSTGLFAMSGRAPQHFDATPFCARGGAKTAPARLANGAKSPVKKILQKCACERLRRPIPTRIERIACH